MIELFATFRNNTSSDIHAGYRLDWFEPAGSKTIALTIPSMGRKEIIIPDVPSAAAYAMKPSGGDVGGTGFPARAAQPGKAVLPGADAYFVRRQTKRVRVAIAGQDQPMLRKYVAADPMLELVESAKDAQLILAQGAVDDFGDKPAMLFAPAKPPPGWGEDKPLGPVALAGADIAADDRSGIMQESPETPTVRPLDLSGVVVRQVRPWTPYETAGNMRVLLRIKDGAAGAGDALILRSTPEDTREPQPRRVYVAMGIDEANTNFVVQPSFVIFMANAVRWLAEKEGAFSVQYVNVAPMQAGPWHDWQRTDHGPDGSGATNGDGKSSVLPWPGLYKDPSGQWHAVSLPGLASRATDVSAANRTTSPTIARETAPAAVAPQDYLAAIASLPLPAPKPSAYGRELWPALLLVTMLVWLAGWTIRLQ
jgi:hypothetical protein